jgi:hypothetical protein
LFFSEFSLSYEMRRHLNNRLNLNYMRIM